MFDTAPEVCTGVGAVGWLIELSAAEPGGLAIGGVDSGPGCDPALSLEAESEEAAGGLLGLETGALAAIGLAPGITEGRNRLSAVSGLLLPELIVI